MIIYLLAFYLFVDIKNIGITHAKHSAKSNAILTKMHVQPIFSICVLRKALSMVIVVTEKHQKQLFYSSKTPFFSR